MIDALKLSFKGYEVKAMSMLEFPCPAMCTIVYFQVITLLKLYLIIDPVSIKKKTQLI